MAPSIEVGIDATTWSNPRGYGRFTRELAHALVRRDEGFRYTLVIDHEPRDGLPDGVGVLLQRTSRGVDEAVSGGDRRSPLDLLRLARAAARAPFDLFFFPTVYSFYPLLSRIPCVVAFHDTIPERFPRLTFPSRKNELYWRLKGRMAARQARRVMTVSHTSAQDLERYLHIAVERIDVITEGASSHFRPLSAHEIPGGALGRYGIPDAARLLTYAGGLNPHKNVLGLLQALPTVIASHPNVHLAIAGDTSSRGFFDNVSELRDFAAGDAQLASRVHFTGFVPDEDLVVLLNLSEALLLPSFYEGFGLPALEALCCGTPVLASRRGHLPELVGDAGLLFEPDPEDITATLLRFLADGRLREHLRKQTPGQSAKFSWDRGAALAEACFRRCFEKG